MGAAVGEPAAVTASAPACRHRHSSQGDARDVIRTLPASDLVYLDPPYNQHRYFTNYHIWETLVRWDAPEHYGIACKRADARDSANASPFNSRLRIGAALAEVIGAARTELLVVSYNDESWITPSRSSAGCGTPATSRSSNSPSTPSLHRRPDRHPQPRRGEGRDGLAHPQHRVRVRGGLPRPGRGALAAVRHPTDAEQPAEAAS